MSIKKCWYLSHFIERNHSCTYNNIRTKGELLQRLNFSTDYYIGSKLSNDLMKKLVVPTGGVVSMQDEDGIIHTWTAGQIKYNAKF